LKYAMNARLPVRPRMARLPFPNTNEKADGPRAALPDRSVLGEKHQHPERVAEAVGANPVFLGAWFASYDRVAVPVDDELVAFRLA